MSETACLGMVDTIVMLGA